MALVTRAEFDALLASIIEDNTSGSITPEDLRSVFDSLMDSVIWYNEASEGGGGGEGSGDVVGPASATAERVALFDGTTGKLLKQGSGPPVIGAGTVTDGRAVIFSGTTGTGIAQATGAPVLGPGTVTSGRAVLFSGTSGNALSAAAGPPVLGPGAVTSGRAVVFSGTSGDLLAQAAGAPVLGPGTVTDGHVALFDSTTGNLLKTGGAAPVLNTAAGLAAISTTTAAAATHNVTFGTAAFDAMISMTTANVLEKLGLLFAKGGYDATGIASALTVATGDLAIFGPLADTGFRSLTNVSLESAELVQNSFYTGSAADGSAEGKTFAESWGLLQTGRPYAGAQTATLVSNVIQFSVEDGAVRTILAPSALTANSTLSASVWDGILDGEEPVLLRIETGGTGRTFTPTASADGMFPWYDTTVIFTANSYTLLSLFRINNVPQVVKLASALIAGGGAPQPEFIAHEVAVDNPTSATIPPHSAGALEVYYAHFGGGSALPGIPGSVTNIAVDADGLTPGARLCWRVSGTTEAGNTTLAGWTGCSSIHCMIFEQAGGGTPEIYGTQVFANTAAATTTIVFGSLDAGVDAIYVHLAGNAGTDTMTSTLAGTTLLDVGSSGAGVNNHNYAAYTPIIATPGWVSANWTKSGTAGRCNAITFGVIAG